MERKYLLGLAFSVALCSVGARAQEPGGGAPEAEAPASEEECQKIESPGTSCNGKCKLVQCKGIFANDNVWIVGDKNGPSSNLVYFEEGSIPGCSTTAKITIKDGKADAGQANACQTFKDMIEVRNYAREMAGTTSPSAQTKKRYIDKAEINIAVQSDGEAPLGDSAAITTESIIEKKANLEAIAKNLRKNAAFLPESDITWTAATFNSGTNGCDNYKVADVFAIRDENGGANNNLTLVTEGSGSGTTRKLFKDNDNVVYAPVMRILDNTQAQRVRLAYETCLDSKTADVLFSEVNFDDNDDIKTFLGGGDLSLYIEATMKSKFDNLKAFVNTYKTRAPALGVGISRFSNRPASYNILINKYTICTDNTCSCNNDNSKMTARKTEIMNLDIGSYSLVNFKIPSTSFTNDNNFTVVGNGGISDFDIYSTQVSKWLRTSNGDVDAGIEACYNACSNCE
ncbi:MAG: hypothetical protein LBL52_03005 [Rickettsiales bacterium]|nr:hypothetical protein [Rickettsiales bacterium]